ncbi:MAG: P1 family peptidase [Alphaproteobacteria bacterium]|nr:P1 family peptidase [Alphaproteobacteria bacterium]
MPRPTITSVPGVTAGHWTHPAGTTGVTVVRFDAGARVGHVVPASASGSREWGVLEPDHLADRVHAVCLAGGSAFGLAAADGVMTTLAAAGVGLATAAGVVPIVPAAILYDLDQGPHRPDAAAGRAATSHASGAPLPCGAVGAGAGAWVGRGLGAPVRGGIGSTATALDAGVAGAPYTVGVVVAVNAFGAVVHPVTGRALTHPADAAVSPAHNPLADLTPLTHTTLAVVATDAPLDRGAARVVAKMAAAAFARCFRPALTPFDGDVVFVASTGDGPPVGPATLLAVGDAAATALGEAIVLAVRPPDGLGPTATSAP